MHVTLAQPSVLITSLSFRYASPSCGIISLCPANLFLYTSLLVCFMLCLSLHHSPDLYSYHLSLPWPFTPDLKLVCFYAAWNSGRPYVLLVMCIDYFF